MKLLLVVILSYEIIYFIHPCSRTHEIFKMNVIKFTKLYLCDFKTKKKQKKNALNKAQKYIDIINRYFCESEF